MNAINTVYHFLLQLSLMLLPVVIFAQVEICDNGIDDDGDGTIDLNDLDCFCISQTPESLIPNPSFEEQNCCPSGRSELNCAADWIQASRPTTDLIHSCGWEGWEQFPPPMPFPDGEGIMGFRDGRARGDMSPEFEWKEYAGACLINPLKVGTTYRIEFDVGFADRESSPPIEITFFGTSTCANLPFGGDDPQFGCPTNGPGWQKLGEVGVSGGVGNRWINTFIEITPSEDIHAIAIGPPCRGTTSQVSTYYFFDNLILADVKSFGLDIAEKDHPCSDDYTLSVIDFDELNYQWYKDGIAIVGETEHELSRIHGDGSYQVRTIENGNCRLSEPFDYIRPVDLVADNQSICDDQQYRFGDRSLTQSGMYVDTFRSVYNCDSIVMLDLEVIGSVFDTLSLNLFQGQSINISGNTIAGEGAFPLVLESSLGCDSLLMVDISYSDVFIPNVFYPLSATGNDTFRPVLANDLDGDIDMQIFDRFGGRAYRGTEWNGGEYPAGVYIYRIDVNFTQGSPETFFGTVTLLR
jgi:hypothetical protein